MVAKNKTAQGGNPAGIAVTADGRLKKADPAPAASSQKANDGGKGPPSALEGGQGSLKDAGINAQGDRLKGKGQNYSVQVHTAKRGLEVIYVTAESGDEAAAKALKQHGYEDTSIRGVTPASDPDANSMGGERDAAAMISNAANPGAIVNTLGTEANAEATKKLGIADIKDLND